jgi:taurine dioxygenase
MIAKSDRRPLLRTPVARMTDADIAELRELIWSDALVVLTNQESLGPTEFVDWAHRMGEPQIYPIENYHHPDFSELYVSSNVELDAGRYGVARTGYYWHTDCPFLETPVPLTSLHLQVVPRDRRETWFINMAEVLEALPERVRRGLENRYAWHWHKGKYKIREQDVGKPMHELIDEIESRWPAHVHPCVAEHPRTGRKSLYVNSGFTIRFDGESEAESAQLLEELCEFSEREDRVIRHVWGPGQIVVFDNRQLIHRNGNLKTDGEYVMFRISIFDGLPFFGNAHPKPPSP